MDEVESFEQIVFFNTTQETYSVNPNNILMENQICDTDREIATINHKRVSFYLFIINFHSNIIENRKFTILDMHGKMYSWSRIGFKYYYMLSR